MDILVIDARYHPDVADALVDGATAALEKGAARFERVSVPGVLEIPAAIAIAARTERYAGFVALGSITGHPNTAHTLHAETLRGLMTLATAGIALGTGIVLAADEGAAHDIAVSQDIGGDAGRAVLALANFADRLGYMR